MSEQEQETKTKYFKVLGEGFRTRGDFDWSRAVMNGEAVQELDCEISAEACGKGLHVWKNYPRYSIIRYIPDHTFEVEVDESSCLGQDEEKARFQKVKIIRLVPKDEIFKPEADLTRAYLAGVNLSRAYLARADLTRAYLAGADLTRANLTGANLARADLARADLSGAYLAGADLTRADLTGANLTGADLAGAHGCKTNSQLTDKQKESCHC